MDVTIGHSRVELSERQDSSIVLTCNAFPCASTTRLLSRWNICRFFGSFERTKLLVLTLFEPTEADGLPSQKDFGEKMSPKKDQLRRQMVFWESTLQNTSTE